MTGHRIEQFLMIASSKRTLLLLKLHLFAVRVSEKGITAILLLVSSWQMPSYDPLSQGTFVSTI